MGYRAKRKARPLLVILPRENGLAALRPQAIPLLEANDVFILI
jgi:hypothetical protein